MTVRAQSNAQEFQEIIKRDDAQALRRHLTRNNICPSYDVYACESVVEWAIRADALECFKACVEILDVTHDNGLEVALWGGYIPLVHAVCSPNTNSMMWSSRCAPKCRDWALARDPMMFSRRDGNDASILAWSSVGPTIENFQVMLDAASLALEKKKLSKKAFDALCSESACRMVKVFKEPAEVFARFDALEKRGFDWRVNKATAAESVLGVALRDAKQKVVIALIDAGADPLSTFVEFGIDEFGNEHSSKPQPSVQALFDLHAKRWNYSPLVAQHWAKVLPDALFIKHVAPGLELAARDSGSDFMKILSQDYKAALGEYAQLRLDSIKERAGLKKSIHVRPIQTDKGIRL